LLSLFKVTKCTLSCEAFLYSIDRRVTTHPDNLQAVKFYLRT